MAASNAVLGYGTIYEIASNAGGTTWTKIGEVLSVTPPDAQTDEVETTHMESPGRTREFIAGLINLDDVSFDINWIPDDATDKLIQGLRASGEKRQHRITWPNGVKWTYLAFLKGFAPSVSVDDRLTATVTAKVAGSLSITPVT